MTIPDLLRAVLEAHIGTATLFEGLWLLASVVGVIISLVNLRDAHATERESRDPVAIFDMLSRNVDVENVQLAARGFIRAEKVRLYVKSGFALFGVLAMLSPPQHAWGSMTDEVRGALFSLFAISLVVVMDWQSACDRDDRRRMIANAARGNA